MDPPFSATLGYLFYIFSQEEQAENSFRKVQVLINYKFAVIIEIRCHPDYNT
jgi:hypothetical protein